MISYAKVKNWRGRCQICYSCADHCFAGNMNTEYRNVDKIAYQEPLIWFPFIEPLSCLLRQAPKTTSIIQVSFIRSFFHSFILFWGGFRNCFRKTNSLVNYIHKNEFMNEDRVRMSKETCTDIRNNFFSFTKHDFKQ